MYVLEAFTVSHAMCSIGWKRAGIGVGWRPSLLREAGVGGASSGSSGTGGEARTGKQTTRSRSTRTC